MKTFSADLTALLAAGAPCTRIDLFAIGPCQNGAYIYATNGPRAVTFGGNTYQPSQWGSWSRGDVTEKIGLESNSCDLTVFADNQVPVYFPGTSNAAQLMSGIKVGLLGDAGVTIYTLYNSDYMTGYSFPAVTGPTGGSLVETKFVGMVGPIAKAGMTKATITVQDMMYLLNTQVPCRLIEASCSHTLFDVGCTLSAATFTKTGAAASVTYPYEFLTTAVIPTESAAGTFAQGLLTWTSGANAGLTYCVQAWTKGTSASTIVLDVQPIFPITVGDEFQIREGCNKTFASCANLQPSSAAAYTNFGGQPDTPVPETAIGG